jgi:hypothetical protein
MAPKTNEERLTRAEDMLCKLVDRTNGNLTQGFQQSLNDATREITAERRLADSATTGAPG